MEIVKEIKTQIKPLSSLNLKVASLNVKNGENDFYFLSEDLTEILREKLKELKIDVENLKIGYSLSYCQGDGFNFVGDVVYKNVAFKIIKGTHFYEHSHTVDIEVSEYKHKDIMDLNDKEYKKAQQDLKNFVELYHKICKDMENIGYGIIEEQEKENILKAGLNDFCELNNLEDDLDLFNFDYVTEEKKGYIKIAEQGNTNIKGLWIKDNKVKLTDYIKAKSEITEYQTINII
jgi:hypothetical protein